MTRFEFQLYPGTPIEGKPGNFKLPVIEAKAETLEAAWSEAKPKIPEGKRCIAVFGYAENGESVGGWYGFSLP